MAMGKGLPRMFPISVLDFGYVWDLGHWDLFGILNL
jgi:hypothetical protein